MEAVGEIYGTDRRFRGLWALEFGIGGKGVQRDKRLDGRHIFMEYSLYDYVVKRHGSKLGLQLLGCLQLECVF
jgi:hypothetical protein